MPRILICDPVAPTGVQILEEIAEVDQKPGLSEEELIAIIGDYDAAVVRSGTQITRPIIEAATKLQIIGRAGVGVDNIDVEAATERGILVVNSPGGNTVSVAELTMGMLLALERHIATATRSVIGGEWKRKHFMGHQLWGKTLGIIGVGRIGVEVAKRAQAFGMKILGYDPFLTTARAEQLGIKAVSIDEILRNADAITLHVPLIKDTKHLINAEAIEKMKDGALVVNCSRGGVIDEDALYEGLKSGKLGGAGLDVYQVEPPTESPLRELPNVVLTPHLGASTAEAQEQVAVDVSQQIVGVLQGRPPRTAVNMPALPTEAREFIAPYLPLMEKLGRLQAQLSEGRVETVELTYCGELGDYDVSTLTRVFLKGLLQPSFGYGVSYVNAPALAAERGVSITEVKCQESRGYTSLVETKVIHDDEGRRRVRTIDGTLFNNEPFIVGLQGLRVDVHPSGHLLVTFNTDKPGMIGTVGAVLGDAGVNVSGMHVGRKAVGERAVMIVALEEPAPQSVLDELMKHPDLFGARQVDLT